MMNFESDLVPATDLPYGEADQLDMWLLREKAWGDWLELTFDPDA